LHILLCCKDRAALGRAADMVRDLLRTVFDQYDRWLENQGADPGGDDEPRPARERHSNGDDRKGDDRKGFRKGSRKGKAKGKGKGKDKDKGGKGFRRGFGKDRASRYEGDERAWKRQRYE